MEESMMKQVRPEPVAGLRLISWFLVTGLVLIGTFACLVQQAEASGTDLSDPAALGGIRVFARPYGGTVCVDDRCDFLPARSLPGEYSCVEFQLLPGHEYHTVTVTLGGYQPYVTRVWVIPDETVAVPVVLQPLP